MQAEGVLHQAVRTGSHHAVEHVLKGLTPKHAANELAQTGSTPLHIAAWLNSLPILTQLLDAGASANIPDEESGWSALAKALYFGHLRAAMLLLQKGASLDLLDNKARKPLDLLSSELQSYNSQAQGRQQQHLVYAWGSGANYQLGTGSTDFAHSPIRVEPLVGSEAVHVACAKYHSAAITSDGHLLTWGWGRGGRLGHPDSHIHSGETALIKPWVVSSLGRRHVVSVAAGKHHMLVLTTAGEVWSFGSNRDGKLGYVHPDTQPTPRKIAALHRIRIVAIAAANKHSAAISASGDVYTWGANSWGQLGYGTSDSSANPNPRIVDALKGKPMQAVAAAKRHTLLLSRDGELWTFGQKRVSPRKINLVGCRDVARDEASLAAAAAAAAAAPSAAAPSSAPQQQGTLQQQLPPLESTINFHKGHSEVMRPTAVAIAAGYAHSCCLTATGAVLAWASGDPQLRVKEVGGPLSRQRAVSVAASKTRTAVTTQLGDVYFWDAKPQAARHSQRAAQQQQQQKGAAQEAGSLPSSLPKGEGPGSWGNVVLGSSPERGVLASSAGKGSSYRGKTGGELMEAALGGGSGGGGVSSSRKRVQGVSSSGSFSGSNVNIPGAGGGEGAAASRLPLTDVALAAVAAESAQPGLSCVPERVPGLKRVMQVACAEKHMLAVCSWSSPPLAIHANLPAAVHASMPCQQQLAQGPLCGSDSSADSASDDDDDEQFAFDAVAGPGSGGGMGPLHPASNAGTHSGLRDSTGASQDAHSADGGGVWGAGLTPEYLQPDPSDLVEDAGQKDSPVPSLQMLAQSAVARTLVEPRTVLQILVYADVAGAHLLRWFCMEVALRNLDLVLLETTPAQLEALPEHLASELEQHYCAWLQRPSNTSTHSTAAMTQPTSQPTSQNRTPSLGASPLTGSSPVLSSSLLDRYFATSGKGGAGAASGAHARALRLQPGCRPTSVYHHMRSAAVPAGSAAHGHQPQPLAGPCTPLQSSSSSLLSQHMRTDIIGCSGSVPGSVEGVSGSSSLPGVKSSLISGGSLISLGRGSAGQASALTAGLEGGNRGGIAAAAAAAAAFRPPSVEREQAEAAERLVRNVCKKLQQVEALEGRAHSGHGPPLDAQQVVKVSQKAALLEALHALEMGVPLESVQQMLAHAQEVAARLAGLPVGTSPPSSTTSLASKKDRPGAPGLETSPGPPAAAGAGAGAAKMGTAKKGDGDKRGEKQPANPSVDAAEAATTGGCGGGGAAAAAAAAGAPGTGKGEGSIGSCEGANKAGGSKEARPQARKGDLSLFLAGALDKKKPAPPALPPRPAGQPAWGGATLLPPPTPSPLLHPTPEPPVKHTQAQPRSHPGGGMAPAPAAGSTPTVTEATAGGATAAAAAAMTPAELARLLMPPPAGPRPPPRVPIGPAPTQPAAKPQPAMAWPKAGPPPAPLAPPAFTSAAGPFPSAIAGGAPQPIAAAAAAGGFSAAGFGKRGPIAAAAAAATGVAGSSGGAAGPCASRISAAAAAAAAGCGASPYSGMSKDMFATPPPKKGPMRAEPDATPSPMSLLFTPLPQPPTPAAPAPQNTDNEPVKFSLAEFMAGPGGAAGKKLAKAQKAPGLPAQPKEVTPVWGGFTYSSSVLSAQEQQTQQTSLRSIQAEQEQLRLGSCLPASATAGSVPRKGPGTPPTPLPPSTPPVASKWYVPEAEQEARRPHASSLTAIQLEEEEAAKRKAIQQEEEAAHKRAALEKAAQRKASRQEKAQRKASARAAGAGAAEGGSSSQRHQSCGTPPAGEAAQRSQQGAGSTEGGSGAGGGGGEHVGKGKQGDSGRRRGRGDGRGRGEGRGREGPGSVPADEQSGGIEGEGGRRRRGAAASGDAGGGGREGSGVWGSVHAAHKADGGQPEGSFGSGDGEGPGSRKSRRQRGDRRKGGRGAGNGEQEVERGGSRGGSVQGSMQGGALAEQLATGQQQQQQQQGGHERETAPLHQHQQQQRPKSQRGQGHGGVGGAEGSKSQRGQGHRGVGGAEGLKSQRGQGHGGVGGAEGSKSQRGKGHGGVGGGDGSRGQLQENERGWRRGDKAGGAGGSGDGAATQGRGRIADSAGGAGKGSSSHQHHPAQQRPPPTPRAGDAAGNVAGDVKRDPRRSPRTHGHACTPGVAPLHAAATHLRTQAGQPCGEHAVPGSQPSRVSCVGDVNSGGGGSGGGEGEGGGGGSGEPRSCDSSGLLTVSGGIAMSMGLSQSMEGEGGLKRAVEREEGRP